MIYNDKFIWLHFPKCAGSRIELLFLKYFGDVENLHLDPIGVENDPTVAWHDSIKEREKKDKDFQLGNRDIIIPIRKLSGWLVSRFCYEVNRSPELNHNPETLYECKFLEKSGFLNNADNYMQKYIPEELFKTNRVRFLRMEHFENDFKSIFGDYLDVSIIPDEEYRRSVNHSKKCISDEVREKLKTQEVLEHAPYWNSIEKVAYKEAEIENEVLKGINGWLYLHGGSNHVYKNYDEEDFFNEEDIKSWKTLLKERKDKLSAKDIEYLHLFVPDKISVYPEYLNYRFKHFEKHPINKFFQEDLTNFNYVINPISYFQAVKRNSPLYYKTDTHWTFWGAFAAFQLILSKFNLTVDLKKIAQCGATSGELLLDLGSKIKSKPLEMFHAYNVTQNAKRVYANELVKKNEDNSGNNIEFHVGSNVVFKNDSENAIDKKVILFGDSFSEYRTHLLTGLFAESFREVHFVWSTSLDFNYIEKNSPDIVISEITERFMKEIPSNSFNLEEFVKQKLEQ